MAKFPTMQEMAKNVAERALNEYEYKGKTIRQWVTMLCKGDCVEVVRCKDCKNAWHSLEGLRCCIWATSEENCETEPDAFCSFGERKDG